MSRKRGEFEHRTSIFEGAYRAWSYLGGLDPIELETKSLADLDPLSQLAEERCVRDPRLDSAEGKEHAGKEKDLERRIYPYEPLPRSGLAHPFVRAILSPWLGPESDERVVECGLTTLRTWWQHRRNGESASAIVALGSNKMQEKVDGYTRHYFTLAYYFVKNDKEAPPRTLFCKQKDLEKERANQVKQKPWKHAPLAVPFANLFMLNPASMAAESYNNSCSGLSSVADAQKNETKKQSKIEQNLQMQSQDILKPCAEVVQRPNNRPSSQNECCKKAKVEKAAYEAHQVSFPTQLEEANKRPSDVNTEQEKVEKFGDEKIPIVLVSSRGDIHIAMKVDGMICSHCVRIVELILKGCSRKRNTIEGLLDAAADLELSYVIIKIDKSSNAKRIAEESTRNLAMMGYTATVMDMSVDIASVCKQGLPFDLRFLSAAFQVFAYSDLDVFDWSLTCSCQENGYSTKDCKRYVRVHCPAVYISVTKTMPNLTIHSYFSCHNLRHNQINPLTFQAFRDHETRRAQYITGCAKRWGGDCTCEVGKCLCSDCGDGCSSRSLKATSVSITLPSSSGCCSTLR